MIIRVAGPEDVPDVIRLTQGFLEGTAYGPLLGAPDPALLEAVANFLIASPDGVIFLADDRGKVRGMLGGFAAPHIITGRKVSEELAWWVEPDARGARAGLLLIQAFEEWSRLQMCFMVKMVAPNPKVARFYTRSGYLEVETAYAKTL